MIKRKKRKESTPFNPDKHTTKEKQEEFILSFLLKLKSIIIKFQNKKN